MAKAEGMRRGTKEKTVLDLGCIKMSASFLFNDSSLCLPAQYPTSERHYLQGFASLEVSCGRGSGRKLDTEWKGGKRSGDEDTNLAGEKSGVS